MFSILECSYRYVNSGLIKLAKQIFVSDVTFYILAFVVIVFIYFFKVYCKNGMIVN